MSISNEVKNALALINLCKDARRLRNIYVNLQNYGPITEEDREILLHAIEHKMREIDPARATKVFGPGDGDARQFLQVVYEGIASRYDLSQNRVRAGAKFGGNMLTGKKYVDLYISYKNSNSVNTGFSWIQETIDTVPFLTVDVRHVGGHDGIPDQSRKFEIEQKDLAAEFYEETLRKILT